MRTLEPIAYAALLLAALLACGNGPAPAGKPEPPIVLRATELHDAYAENEVAADAKFKGRTLRVVGVVTSIDKDLFGAAVVRLASGSPLEVAGTLRDADGPKAAALRKGQPVALECVGAGMVLGSPVLDGCAVMAER